MGVRNGEREREREREKEREGRKTERNTKRKGRERQRRREAGGRERLSITTPKPRRSAPAFVQRFRTPTMPMIITSHVYHDWVPGRHPDIDGWPPRGSPPHRRCTLLCRACDFSLHTTGPERYALHMARKGPDLTLNDWRFVKAVRPEHSAVAPAASR